MKGVQTFADVQDLKNVQLKTPSSSGSHAVAIAEHHPCWEGSHPL